MNSHKNVFHASVLATLLSTVACSGGGSSVSEQRPGPNAYTTIVFARANTLNGSDLYRAPMDGRSPPVNLTRHDFQVVQSTWPRPVENRIVYTAERGGASDFYSVPSDTAPGSAPAYTRLTTQSLGSPDPEDWDIVGDRIVVLATVENVDQLFAVPVDGSAMKQLTRFTSGSIDWPRNSTLKRNLVAEGGFVVFEHEENGRRSVYSVAANGSMTGPRELSNADQATVVLDFAAQPMQSDKRVVLRETNTVTTNYRAANASADNTSRLLTPPLPAHQEVSLAFLFADHFVYQLVDSNADVDSVHSIALAGPVGMSGEPLVNNLTPGLNQPGTRIRRVAPVPGTDLMALVAEQPGQTTGMVFADVFSVRLDDPQTLLQLSIPREVAEFDIDELEVCGEAAFVARLSTPNAVWHVDLRRATSEIEALPSQQGNRVAIERRIFSNLSVDPLSQTLTMDPMSLDADSIILSSTTTGNAGSFTNFFHVTPSATGLVTTRLSNHFTVADGTPEPEVLVQKGTWIAYARSGLLYAARTANNDSEISILNTSVSIADVFGAEGQGAPDHVLLVANGQLFSTRINQPATTPGSTRQLTNLLPTQQFGEVLFNTDKLVLYTVVGQGRTGIHGSPVAPEQPAPFEVSRAIGGVDDFKLAF